MSDEEAPGNKRGVIRTEDRHHDTDDLYTVIDEHRFLPTDPTAAVHIQT